MKKIIACISALLIIVSCGTDSESNNNDFPVKYDTWNVTSRTNAIWNGSRGSNGSTSPDTIIIVPESNLINLNISRIGDKPSNSFELNLTDGTLTYSETWSPEQLSFGNSKFLFPQNFSQNSSQSGSASDSQLEMQISASTLPCSSPDNLYSQDGVILVEWRREDGSLFKVYKFDAKGFKSALDRIGIVTDECS